MNARAMNTFEKQVFEELNKQRERLGLIKLSETEPLLEDARTRAVEASVLWSHTRPNGTQWWTVDISHMYGECLYNGKYGNAPAEIVKAWMDSPTHKAILINSLYKTGSIGAYVTDSGSLYVSFEAGL